MSDTIETHSLYAWVGEDERLLCVAGFTPVVAMDYDKQNLASGPVKLQMEARAKRSGKRIRLVRFAFAEVVEETEAGT